MKNRTLTFLSGESSLAGNVRLVKEYQNLEEGGERLPSKGFKKWCKGMLEAIDHVKFARYPSHLVLDMVQHEVYIYFKF